MGKLALGKEQGCDKVTSKTNEIDKCPKCGKVCKSKKGKFQHMRMKHDWPTVDDILGRPPVKQEDGE